MNIRELEPLIILLSSRNDLKKTLEPVGGILVPTKSPLDRGLRPAIIVADFTGKAASSVEKFAQEILQQGDALIGFLNKGGYCPSLFLDGEAYGLEELAKISSKLLMLVYLEREIQIRATLHAELQQVIIEPHIRLIIENVLSEYLEIYKRIQSRLVERTAELKKMNEQLQKEITERTKLEEELNEKMESLAETQRATLNMLEDLRESENKYRTLVENIPQKIFLKDKNSVYISCNENYARDLKIKPHEINGKTDYDFYPKELAEKYRVDDKRIVESMKTEDIEEKYIQDGEERFVHTVKTPVKDEQGNVIKILSIFWDITEQKKAEDELESAYKKLRETQQELIQSSKMAAMGQLAAGISHELNQPLTGVRGFAQAALMDLDRDNPIRDDLQKIINQADRIDAIIKNIRLFARRSEFKLVEIDINKPVEDSLALLGQQLKVHNIRLKTSLDRDLPKMQGDANQLQQVFLNFITNARDAIDSLKSLDGGELIIKTALSPDKKNIEITFKDTGCGIPQEDLENIFNPFFTTKSPSGGMGLGLAIAYRIIEAHNGRIEVESQVGMGTTFKITLPISSS